MSHYKHILVAIDLSEEAHHVIEKAKLLAASNHAKLTLVHVIKPLSLAYGAGIPVDLTNLQNTIIQQAKERIAQLADTLRLEEGERHIVCGHPEKEVHRIAEESNVDLIVVGSHGRHGLALILGSTSTHILHGSLCDVLAIRVGQHNTKS